MDYLNIRRLVDEMNYRPIETVCDDDECCCTDEDSDSINEPLDNLSDYWLTHYTNKGHCSLCGNMGIIDTTGVKSPVGIPVGRKNYCICPNGQAKRKQSGKSFPE
jgi:hypothetical protein